MGQWTSFVTGELEAECVEELSCREGIKRPAARLPAGYQRRLQEAKKTPVLLPRTQTPHPTPTNEE